MLPRLVLNSKELSRFSLLSGWTAGTYHYAQQTGKICLLRFLLLLLFVFSSG